MRNWRTEILTWYDFPISNAYNESTNRLAKDIKRIGRGYSSDFIHGRLMLDNKARKPKTRVVRSHKNSSSNIDYNANHAALKVGTDERIVEYGPHIPTLCYLLEKGHFY